MSHTQTSQVDNGSLTEFALFPRLPLELRLIIWDLAKPERLITLVPTSCTWLKDERGPDVIFMDRDYHEHDDSCRPDTDFTYTVQPRSARVPVLLHVNRELRTIMLPRYTQIGQSRQQWTVRASQFKSSFNLMDGRFSRIERVGEEASTA
ncbi:hypothetical protein B0T17DRAFT_509214 [Bombardia bombarda]|uniref:2EXR domain-containing protein n=1 Tax=Bombardia bombarda TaxID=252184 RepID=A0AA39WUM0_9PEZI|nr:hypothetical protein B0T17DRAFT_509214 [Bombardia bombarda]